MEGCIFVMWMCIFVLIIGSRTATSNSEGAVFDYPVESVQSVYVDEYPNCSSVADTSLDECADILEDLYCGNSDILLNDSSLVRTVQAPPGIDENQCVNTLSCAWFITSDPGTSIYIQVHAQRGSHSSYSYSLYDEVVIGRGHDPFNTSSVAVEVELFYNRRLDDGRVYIIDSNQAWVRIFAHSEGYPDCVWFEMSFTQREKPGICDRDTTLCAYSSVCLPAEAGCDTFVDCGDFSDQLDCKMCGHTNITLAPNTPIVIKYGLPGYAPGYSSNSDWNPPKMDCVWVVSAPNDTVMEINILATNLIGPDVHIGSAMDGANVKSERLFDIKKPVRDPGIMYTAVSSIWIHSDITSASFHRGTVFEIKLTAYEKEECDPGEFQCFNQECLPGSALCDGFADCFVKEDEYGCDPQCNFNNFYMCPDGEHCIHSDWICDGFGKCDGLEDEFECGE